MKKLALISIFYFITASAYSKPEPGINWKYNNFQKKANVLLQQVELRGNNISSFFLNLGKFDHDNRTANTPGFEWPLNSGHFACYGSGFTIGTKIAGILKEAVCYRYGEFEPGYIIDSAGIPVPKTNSDFKIYKVSSGDNSGSNPDYANWYKMVPFGAPYDDINLNGVYDNGIDKPGIKNASSTLFSCITDGFPADHTTAEGFGGGTAPIFSEIHFTAWSYNSNGLENVQFLRWTVINKNTQSWDSTAMSLVTDPDLGYAGDYYIGCDSLLSLGYCFNADNDDSGDPTSYGVAPPAFGIDILKGPKVSGQTLCMTSFDFFKNDGPACENQPSGNQSGAYNMICGLKKDGTSWINRETSVRTKFCYSGDPETEIGWIERKGRFENCNGDTLSGAVNFNIGGERYFLINTGSRNFRMQPNDTQTVVAAQMVARGTGNTNSVTLLKQLDVTVQNYYNANLVNANYLSLSIPGTFYLHQNYPNPFNPATKINYDLPIGNFVTLKVYDAIGNEVETLVNEKQNAGSYSVSFNAVNYPSGVYFYKLVTEKFSKTRKMILLK